MEILANLVQFAFGDPLASVGIAMSGAILTTPAVALVTYGAGRFLDRQASQPAKPAWSLDPVPGALCQDEESCNVQPSRWGHPQYRRNFNQ